MNAIRTPAAALTLAAVAAAVAGATAAILPASPAAASDKPRGDEIRALRESGRILPMEDILARARAIRPGQIVEVELEHENARYVYELKIIDDTDRVHKLEIDAVSGEVVERKTEYKER